MGESTPSESLRTMWEWERWLWVCLLTAPLVGFGRRPLEGLPTGEGPVALAREMGAETESSVRGSLSSSELQIEMR